MTAATLALPTTTTDEGYPAHDDTEEAENDSADEALLDMLGLASMKEMAANGQDDENDNGSNDESPLPDISDHRLQSLVDTHRLGELYDSESVCIFPPELSIPAAHMRRLTDELVWGGPTGPAVDKTYETIHVWKRKKQPSKSQRHFGGPEDTGFVDINVNGEMEQRRTLTRLEHFVDAHLGWSDLAHGHVRRILSAALGVDMVLYKEKLNLKPPGGSGFAPHLDSPSLRVALGPNGPQTFCTVMVAIDDMTSRNGCLRIAKGRWTEDNSCAVVAPEEDGNPDAGGRAGAIPPDVAEQELDFEDLECKGGSIVAFNGWAPHRSAANASPFSRRAVFLTYNPRSEGDFHKQYYQKMEELRSTWRERVGLANRQQREEDEKFEMSALATIPKI